jgi:hypothetical protein
MEIHLSAHRDYRVGVGVLVYADLEFHRAVAPLSAQGFLKLSPASPSSSPEHIIKASSRGNYPSTA